MRALHLVVAGALVSSCGGLLAEATEERVAICAFGDCDDVDSGVDATVDSRGDGGIDLLPRPEDASVDGPTEPDTCSNGVPTRFASRVVAHAFGTGQDFNQRTGFPDALLGPPVANEPKSVVSLGNGGWVVLAFAGTSIVDGPGPDFIVFENPLSQFKELATVAVSDDGIVWTSFPCTWQRGDTDYGSCAGAKQVFSSPTNGIDPTDPRVSGGDSYDLHDIGVSRARYVKITDRADLTGTDGVFDLDAVALVHAECR